MSVVYFCECADADAVKIGWANVASKRLMQHQCGCPYELKLIAQFEGGVTLEQRIHLALTGAHIRGEWVERGAALSFLNDAQWAGIEGAINMRLEAIAERRVQIAKATADLVAVISAIEPKAVGRNGICHLASLVKRDPEVLGMVA